MNIEETSCLICGSEAPIPDKAFSFGRFQVVQCSACDFRYLNPRLPESEMARCYADPGYFTGEGSLGYTGGNSGYKDQESTLRKTFRRFAGQLGKYGLTGGRLLEIGCGYGLFLEESRGLFEKSSGLDPNPLAVETVSRKGFPAIPGDSDSLAPDDLYDIILSQNVLEHIYDPVPWIEKLAGHLKPGGWMIHATPRVDGFWFKVLGRHWPSFKVPEHVGFYSNNTLAALYERCGSLEIRSIPYPHAFPLKLVLSKLGIPGPLPPDRFTVWLPGIMVAMAARFTRAL